MEVQSIEKALKSLKLALRQSFILKEQCTVLRKVIETLAADVKSDPDWYAQGEKLCSQILRLLKKFLRFARINLKVTENRRANGLGDIRKARSLCNVNKLRETLNGFSSELQLIIFSSRIQKRIGTEVGPLFQSITQAYNPDKEQIIIIFEEVLNNLQSLPNMEQAMEIYDNFIGPLSQKDPYDVSFDDFDDPVLGEFSYNLEQKLLSMISQDPTPHEALEMKYSFRKGRFGEIFTGTLGGPMPVCIQKIDSTMLQTLSSEGRIKLYSTIRRISAAKDNDTFVKVIGTCLHRDILYIALERVHFSLKDLLHGHQGLEPEDFHPNQLLYTFHGVVTALEYLEKEGVVHGDLRPDNIFFTRKATEGSVKLANFSYELNLTELHWSTWNEVAIRYQAPEVLSNQDFTVASDVFALAVCMWESTQENDIPFGEFEDTQVVHQVKAGKRPKFTGGKKEVGWLRELTEKCWTNRPWERPGILSIKNKLENVCAQSGLAVEDLGVFVAPMVKRREEEGKSREKDIDVDNRTRVIKPIPEQDPPRPNPGINETPKSPPRPFPSPLPPRPVDNTPVSPPRPFPSPIPPRQVDTAPVSPPRPFPSPIPPRQTNERRAIPEPPGGGRTLPNPPTKPLPPRQSLENTMAPRPLPGIVPRNERPIPGLVPGNGRPLPGIVPGNGRPLPGIVPGNGRPLPGIVPGNGRPLPGPPNNSNNDGRPLPRAGMGDNNGRPLPTQPPREDKFAIPPRQVRPVPPVAPTPPTRPQESNTLARLENERDSNEEDKRQRHPAAISQPEATGVNGLTAKEVRLELIKFYEENDPDMLTELNNLVNWCMVNGLEQFEKLLVERFGKGLPMFSEDQEESEEEDAGGGMGGIFRSGAPQPPNAPQRPPGLHR